MIKKIVVIGPESTGKSTLCAQLATLYQTDWVKEYARECLLTNGTDYTFDDLLDVAKGQIAVEDAAVKLLEQQTSNAAPILFVDTDMQVMKVWCEFVFNQCHHWILNTIVERKYDLYLLCNIDLPWVEDELREYPDWVTREKLYHHYKDILINQNVPWVAISGTEDERLQNAVKAVENLLA